MDKIKKQAYLLFVLAFIFITISFFIGVIFDNSGFSGYMTGEQMLLEIAYYILNFGAFLCVILAIFMLIKNKENTPIKNSNFKMENEQV